MTEKTESGNKTLLYKNGDLKELILPLVVEQFLAIAVGLVDSIMVSVAGEAAVSGVSLVDSIFVLIITVFTALASGGAVIAGRFIGQRKNDRGSEAVDQLVIFTFLLSVAVTALIYLCKPFILNVIFGDIDADVMHNCNVYLLITAASIPFIALYNAAAALFRAMNDSKTSMKIAIIMNVLHIAGNTVLLYGFHWGVAGVAVPTLGARIFAAVAIMILLKDQRRTIHFSKPFRFVLRKKLLKDILYIGVPNSVENSMFQIGKIVILSFVSSMGTSAITANAIGNSISMVAAIPGLAIGYALLAVVSQCTGAGDFDQVRMYTKKLMKWEYAALLAFNAVIVACLPLLMKLYHLSAATSRLAMEVIIMHAVMCCLIWPLAFTLPNTLRASSDVMYTMIWSAISMWIFRVIGARMLGGWLGLGLIGVWIAMFIDWAFRAAMFIYRYKKGKWQYIIRDKLKRQEGSRQ